MLISAPVQLALSSNPYTRVTSGGFQVVSVIEAAVVVSEEVAASVAAAVNDKMKRNNARSSAEEAEQAPAIFVLRGRGWS